MLIRGSQFYDEKWNLLAYGDITLMKKISQEINYIKRNNSQSALLFVYLDDFKVINDTHEHNHGDEFVILVIG